jgi:aquaporin Z
MAKLVTELVGTFFLVLVIGLVSAVPSPVGPLAIGSILMGMIYMGGHVSGAHYNPAVTLGVLLRRAMTPGEAAGYWTVQFVGAVLAALTAWTIVGHTFAPGPAPGAVPIPALLVELLFTTALVLVIFNVAGTKATEGNSYFGLAIGFTVLAGALAGGGISGGAFNPAVGLGPMLVHVLAGHPRALTNVWLYIVGPGVGAVLAVVIYRLQHQPPQRAEQRPLGHPETPGPTAPGPR